MKELHVSDHALLRYLGRVLEVDVESLRQQMAKLVAGPVAAGAKRFSIDGMTFCARYDGDKAFITTIYTGERPNAAANRVRVHSPSKAERGRLDRRFARGARC